MGRKVLMKGNIALAEGAVLAGCRYYFGYPITPQNEVPEYLSVRLPEAGGVFLQAESELAAVNMLFGATAAGARAMTTTSSPGFSLMMEGVSYLAGAHLPAVLANIQRGGPGLGNIAPGQADYFQAVKGGGHGDYHLIVLAPSSPQEMMDYTILAFDLADKYRVPALILSDGLIGLMMETVEIPDTLEVESYAKPWALTGAKGRDGNVIRSLWLDEDGVWKNNLKLQEKYRQISETEVRYEKYLTDDAEIVFIAYGLSSRAAKSVVEEARQKGYPVGLLRPITLWPFPVAAIEELIEQGVGSLFCVEMSAGQMVDDVRLAANGKVPVHFYGTFGGKLINEKELLSRVTELVQPRKKAKWL